MKNLHIIFRLRPQQKVDQINTATLHLMLRGTDTSIRQYVIDFFLGKFILLNADKAPVFNVCD